MMSWDQLFIQFNSAPKPKKLRISIEEENVKILLNFFKYAKTGIDLSQVFWKIISERLKNSRGETTGWNNKLLRRKSGTFQNFDRSAKVAT